MDTNQQAPMQIPAEISTYLNNLLIDAGMDAIDDVMREEMIKELFVRLDAYISQVIVEELPDDTFDQFIKLHEEQKPQAEIEKFLTDNVPNIQDVMGKAFADFREMYLANVTAFENAPSSSPEDAKVTS